MCVAILIDGDNLSPTHAPEINRLSMSLGQPTVRRVYGDALNARGWRDLPGYRFVDAGEGKNSADMLLALDACEMALMHEMSDCVIASSDSDLRHVAFYLRERDIRVLGLGERKAPASFRAACSTFHVLGQGVPQKPVPSPTCTDLDQKVRSLIAQHSVKGTGMEINHLSGEMHKTHGVQISTHKEKTWRGYLGARPDLYDLDPKGPAARVRFKPSGFQAT